ncbi:Protein of unknown function [Salegentibacter holothuriorum]|uniref:DUF2851 domain-containing protein n=1 Tax=Salegentibacter holothuriorum TaxID=241145 RepID=A0A1T5CMS3_9FLAO|nr:DUF2851 family protein [Salegentibacter holothuriorum]SKB60747.1 Protein of unknown function [Salegentibacter holothuriorum]
MREDFLHYLWKYKKFDFTNAKTTQGEKLLLIDSGIHNFNSGPDFFNARLKIGNQIWAGNVELHTKASDWYFHQHEKDRNYDNVILHVVWEDDVEVKRQNKSSIPALSLKSLVDSSLINDYQKLFASSQNWINCEKSFQSITNFTLRHWQERLYIERLEEKSELIQDLLKKSGNNWELVLFQMLAKNFGLNLNGDAFLSMAQSLEFPIIQKASQDNLQMEALLFGQCGLLERPLNIPYYLELKKEYAYLSYKYKLSNAGVIRPKYFRLRPDNFPNIRLSQLASLYTRHRKLFSELIVSKSLEAVYSILSVETSLFWKTHFTFQKKHKKREKALSIAYKDLLLINTIIPLRFCYSQAMGNDEVEELLSLMQQLSPENNKIIQNFKKLKKNCVENSMHSQAMVQLKKNYCEANKCLDCAIGVKLLHGKA